MTSVAAPLDTGRTWRPADGVAVRGHVILLAGRGEHAGVYERLGRRLAFDGYRLSAVGGTGSDELRAAFASGDGVVPVVLAGSDTGALHALALVGEPGGVLSVAGLLLAGLPIGSAADPAPTDWPGELDARSACPVHRDRLGDDGAFRRGALGEPIPPELAAAAGAGTDLPVLIVHGGADPVAPVAGVRAYASGLTNVDVVVIRDGRHDILNDLHHRTVAAHVIGWLERLRAHPSARSIVAAD